MRIYLRGIVAIIITVFFSSASFAQSRGPLSLEEIEEMMQVGETAQPLIIILIETHGVSFALTDKVRARLKRAGAEASLLEAIEKAGSESAAPPPPEEPPTQEVEKPPAEEEAPKEIPSTDDPGMEATPKGTTSVEKAGSESAAPPREEESQTQEVEKAPVEEDTLKSTISAEEVAMVEVPAGKFWMGCSTPGDSECDNDEKPGRTVPVDTFRLDRTEVTVAQYTRCVEAGGCNSEGLTMEGVTIEIGDKDHSDWIQECNWGKADRTDRPINCINWQQASAYCRWAGKRLPTEIEWEKAARGKDKRPYPWGKDGFEKAGRVANIADETFKRKNPDMPSAEGYDDGFLGTAPVGSFREGASPEGALDMIGNVAEWTADRHDAGDAQLPIARGGSWLVPPRAARASDRVWYGPDTRSMGVGFRCAQ